MAGRIRAVARVLWINATVIVVVLGLLEGAARAYLAYEARVRGSAGFQQRVQNYQSDQGPLPAWVPAYVRELDEAREGEWHPYVYWRRKPYRGTYVNIDEAGIRRTWNRAAAPRPGQPKVFMFGGSTLWGVGARDDFTIPSLVSKKLSVALPSGAWVKSFADIGYVTTQDVIALILELRQGHVPDAAVFLDGVNDTFAAIQGGVAGLPQNEAHRVAEFDSLVRFDWRRMLVERTALFTLVQAYARSRGSVRPRFAAMDDALADAVVETYLWNVGLVETLGRRYGFRAAFFWQPTVFTKARLSTHERRWYETLGRKFTQFGSTGPALDAVHRALVRRLRAGGFDHVHDLSSVFDDAPDTIYIDEWHITENGNEKIAGAMTRTLLDGMIR
jgi:hypothetical protein